MTEAPTKNELTRLGEALWHSAYDIFVECKIINDFSVDFTSLSGVVFGKNENKLCWSAEKGFYVDKRFCSQEFLENFNELKKN